MNNPDVFQFKGFDVVQGNSGLKVNSDAVIIASWFKPKPTDKILDIGCGTGVISCILSKRFPEAKIDGIDIDKNAQGASLASFARHPNAKNLKLIPGDFRDFTCDEPYDSVVCNPPYFNYHLEDESSRNTARQQGYLNLKELFAGINRVLSKSGTCAIIVPRRLKEECEFLGLQENLYLVAELIFTGSMQKPFNHCVLLFKRQYQPFASDILIMFEMDGSPTPSYQKLVGDLYAQMPKR